MNEAHASSPNFGVRFDILRPHADVQRVCTLCQGWVSGADYAGRKTTLVLFINGRTVECSPLKRALEATYATILPKASKPFIYLVRDSRSFLPSIASVSCFCHTGHAVRIAGASAQTSSQKRYGLFLLQDLRMPGPHVDVNVHPTKREVGFLHQEALIDALRTAVEEKLLVSNDRRGNVRPAL